MSAIPAPAVVPETEQPDHPDLELAQLAEQVKALAEQQAAMNSILQAQGIEGRVLEEMHEQNRVLREHLHEREILDPIFRLLIGLADRCREENLERVRSAQRLPRDAETSSLPEQCQIIAARSADLVEIEALLATFGVESYHHPGEHFESCWQKCVRTIPRRDPRLHQSIAGRLLPGYRRGDRIIRPEYVTVHIVSSH